MLGLECSNFPKMMLEIFGKFCATQAVDRIFQNDANLIRQYIRLLEQMENNPGGIQARDRVLKTFLFLAG